MKIVKISVKIIVKIIVTSYERAQTTYYFRLSGHVIKKASKLSCYDTLSHSAHSNVIKCMKSP